MLDSREEETKSADFPLITFIKPHIIDYFYNGDKFKILLIRLEKGMFKSKEEKNNLDNSDLLDPNLSRPP